MLRGVPVRHFFQEMNTLTSTEFLVTCVFIVSDNLRYKAIYQQKKVTKALTRENNHQSITLYPTGQNRQHLQFKDCCETTSVEGCHIKKRVKHIV